MGFRRGVRRAVLAVLIASVAVSSSGCGLRPSAPDGSNAASLAELAEERLTPLAGVDQVTASQSPLDSGADPADTDPWDPDLSTVAIEVSMSESATRSEIGSASEAARAFSSERAGSGPWTVTILAGRVILGDDIAPSRSIRIDVFPETTVSTEQLARDAMDVAAIDGVDTVVVFRGRPTVTVLDAAALDAVHDQVRELAMMADGAEYGTSDARLRITERPGQLTPAAVDAIVAIAAAYPAAPVALTAALDGPSAPALFIDRVTEAEAQQIAATLSDPAMADANRGDYVIPFAIRYDGSGDLAGTFGGVPRTD